MAQAPFRQRTTFPATPKIADLIFTEVEMRDRASLPAYGTAHWDTTRYANHKLVLVRPDTSDGAPEDRYLLTYAADRANQDDYNFEHVVADIGDTKYNLVRRTYVTPRASYNSTSPAMGATMADTPAGMFSGTFVLAGRQESRIGDDTLDSMYVAEVRTYIDRATLSESDFNASSGVSTVRNSNLYYRGELVGGTAIETLVADPDHVYWDGNGGSVRYREFKTLSENWFLVIETGIGLSDEAKVSRVFDTRNNLWVDITTLPVVPGTADGEMVGDTISETRAQDYLQSQKETRDPDIASAIETSSQKVDQSAGALMTTTKVAISKGSATPGVSGGQIIEVDGDDPQLDTQITTEATPLNIWFTEYQWDNTLAAMMKIRKKAVTKDSVTGSFVGGVLTEVRPYSPLIDLVVESSFVDRAAILAKTITLPASFRNPMPRVLLNVRVVGVKAWAVNENDFAYDFDYYFETAYNEPVSGNVTGQVVRIFCEESDLDTITSSYPAFDFGERADTFGVLEAFAFASDSKLLARTTAKQISLPPSIHDTIVVDVSFAGTGVEVGSNQPSTTITLPATPNWGSYPEWMTVDIDAIPRNLGIWEVQVKQVSAGGISSGSGNAPQFAPILVAPALGQFLYDSSAILDWGDVRGATSYDIEYATNAALTSPTSTTSTTSTKTLSLSASTKYWWRVRAVNSNGNGPWSSIYYFTTSRTATLTSPTLLTPTDTETGVGIPPELSWTPDSGMDYIHVHVDTSSSFLGYRGLRPMFERRLAGSVGSLNELVYDNGTSYVLDPNTTYYWRARFEDGIGVSAWVTRSFTTGNGVGKPALVSPANASTITDRTPTFTWTAANGGASTYDIQVASDSGFTSIERSASITSPTVEKTFTTDEAYGTHYWRVRTIKGGLASAWTTGWSYTVTIEQAVITAPYEGETGVSTTPTITWDAVTDADEYEVDIATDAAFTTIVDSTTANVPTSYTVTVALAAATLHYVRVRGKETGASVYGAWSETVSFTTA